MSGAEDTSLSPAHWAATGPAAAPAGAPPRRRLFRKYALLFIALVGAALLINSAFDFWFSYQENKAALIRVQQEKADAAAARIEEFIDEIERQIGWTTHAQWASGPLDQRRQDYFRLLRQVPAITELSQLDAEGKEQLKVSRLSMDVVGSGEDFSQKPAFIEAKANHIWFSPVYFRKESEPYMTVALAREGRNAGVTVAEINLKLIWDVITALKIGEGGYAYVVDGHGRLIAHPDISLVLRDTDLSKLPQVAAALAQAPGARGDKPEATIARNLAGRNVLTAHAAITPLGWRVFVEVPLAEALAPLYAEALRTLALLAFGLIAATLVALVIARRMTGPIRRIAEGAERIGAGELDRRIEIHTGDELEALAEQFNRMGADLQKSYAELEQRVRDRTAELSESLDQQTATAEVLGVINSSPGDLAPVFDAMLDKAMDLCGAAFGTLWTFDGESYHAAALHRVPKAYADFQQQAPIRADPSSKSVLGQLAAGSAIAQILDAAAETAYRDSPAARALIELGGARTVAGVPLRKDATQLGAITIYRQEVRPFTDKQIALLQNFAAQAVIAMENARLITETREALEQQTATGEVLQVINSSPGDLAPVFDAMLEKAHSLCGADYGALLTYDGERFWPVAGHGGSAKFAEVIGEHGFLPPAGGALWRLIRGDPFAQIDDVAEVAAQHPDESLLRALVEVGGIRTQLVVPLRKDEALLGALTANRYEVRPFSDKQIALLQNFAAQAVIAMENARLITETREALEQQTATAEVLQVINSSPGDLAPVFETMLDKAADLCAAEAGVLFTYEHEHFQVAAWHGELTPLRDFLTREPLRPSPNTGLGRMARERRLIHIADVASGESYNQGDPLSVASVELGGIRTFMAVPLVKEGSLLGAFTLYRQQVQPFSDKQIALVQNFTAQAVIAMENARLITETREALDQQTATAEVLQVINSSPGDLKPVFEAILEKAHSLCEAPRGALLLYDGEYVRAVAVRGFAGEFADWLRQGIPGSETQFEAPLRAGERFVHIPDQAELDHPTARAGTLAGTRTLLTVPLRKGDALLGVIVAARTEVRPFSDKQIALLENFAAQAVIAMENARLITETREALEQQTATAEVLQVINSSPGDLAPVFDAILEKAHSLCGAPSGSLQIYDGERFRAVATRGLAEPFAAILRQGFRPDADDQSMLNPDRVIQIANEAETVAHLAPDSVSRAAVDLSGTRTVLFVPLHKDNTFLGRIVAARHEVRPFSDKQIALLQNFAAQAVIAMENARLITETRERTRDLQESLEYQTATSDVLKVISQSTFDLQPVLDTLVETAARLCDAEMGHLAVREGEAYRYVATSSLNPEWDAIIRARSFTPGRGSVVARTALERRIVHVADIAADPEYTLVEAFAVGKIHTVLGVPLLREGEPIGVISVARHRVEPFDDKEIALVTTFADQAVIAIENARLLGELRERTDDLARSVEELKALGEVGQAVSATLDLRGVLVTILNRSVALAGADAGMIFRYSRAERAFHFVEAVGSDETMLRAVRDLDVGETVTGMGEAIAKRAPLQIPDLLTRPSNPVRDAAVAAGYRSVLIVPLVGADRVMGVTILQRRAAGEFPEATIRLMQTLASQSVLAIQNARLFREIADKSEQLAQASQHKSQFLANMSHELRTPLNAILGYAELLVDGIYGAVPERAMGVLERVQNNGRHLLALINDVLDLSKIEAGQLVLTLEDYAMPDVVQSVVSATEGLANTKGIKLSADVAPGLPAGRGDARRLSQVLLNLVGNAVKFTDEGEVAIGAMAENGNFVLTVRDTGPGIAPADHDKIFGEFQQVDNSNTRKKGGTGLGLAISKRIVEMQGGTITVDSELGQGATFRVTLPVRVEHLQDELTGELAGELMGAAQ